MLIRACKYDRHRRHRRHHDDEDQRQDGEQNGQRHLVRRLLPFGAFHELDHAIEKALAGISGDANQQLIRNQRCARGHRGEHVGSRLLSYRRRLSGDRRFVHIGHTFDHLAVGRNDLALVHPDDLSLRKFGRRHLFDFAGAQDSSGHQFGLGPPQ